MSDDVFDGQALSDKLFKLNSSQQSIESLSRSCISQRKKAKQIVEIWHKSFKSAQREQHVSFLYLANDILQNSRRKGSEFVNEFWKVMPSALKHATEHGDDNGKKAASRLVGIWDERRVFGSRVQSLKDEMLGKSPLPQLANNGKTSNSNPIKIVKRDANSLRLKLAVGGTPEKIMTAFHLVHDENATEDTALNNCESAVRRFGDLERDIETQGVVQGSSLLDEIQEQENVLQECVNQLETAERTRTSLISQLKVALEDQESKLDVIHNQLQVARSQIDHAVNLRKKLASPSVPGGEVTNVVDNLPQSMSFGSSTHATEEESKKAAAAAVAAKLAASTSSAQMLTSVLSSLVAEEAASISNSFNSAGFTTASLSLFPPEKRPKLEKPMPVPDLTSSDAVSSGYFTSTQTQYPPPPPLPPPPAIGGTNSPANQFVQSSGVLMAGMPYVYAAGSLPPPPPPPPVPPHMAMGLMRPAHQPPQQQQQQQSQPPQNTGGGYYRPPGIGFYGQSHQQTPPPVPRQ